MWWKKTAQRAQARLLFSGTRGREQRPQQLPFVKRWFFAFITIIFFLLNH
jgi:hypothetical protein